MSANRRRSSSAVLGLLSLATAMAWNGMPEEAARLVGAKPERDTDRPKTPADIERIEAAKRKRERKAAQHASRKGGAGA